MEVTFSCLLAKIVPAALNNLILLHHFPSQDRNIISYYKFKLIND